VDLTALADEVGGPDAGTVSPAGLGSRGGGVPGARTVRAPSGIETIRPDEMTVVCGAGTPVDELGAALAEHGQEVALPSGGTIGGALSVGRSDVLRLGRGPVRDAVLQVRYVSAGGEVVKAGGPTVKNVSGFDLCRVLVGSRGTLGVLGEVILRTRPIPPVRRWFTGTGDPFVLARTVYRPASVLWDGGRVWVCLEGHSADVAATAAAARLTEVDGPPALPDGGRWSLRPSELRSLWGTGRFVAEVGVGVVHHEQPPPAPEVPDAVRELNRRIKVELDPTGRLNPGLDLLGSGR
jgi:glycolate oxidase FAD binding subunit